MEVLKYIPLLFGCFAYVTLSVYLIMPQHLHLAIKCRDLLTSMLAATMFSLFLYIYDRSFLRSLPNKRRFIYSCICSLLCTLGTTELWLKYFLPYRDMLLATALGLTTGFLIVMIFLNYLIKPPSDEDQQSVQDETPHPEEEQEFLNEVMESPAAPSTTEIPDHEENMIIISIIDQDLQLINRSQLRQEQQIENDNEESVTAFSTNDSNNHVNEGGEVSMKS